MSIESERIKRIKARWESESKISSGDVKWLIEQARAADMMRAAESLKQQNKNPITDLFGEFFR